MAHRISPLTHSAKDLLQDETTLSSYHFFVFYIFQASYRKIEKYPFRDKENTWPGFQKIEAMLF